MKLTCPNCKYKKTVNSKTSKKIDWYCFKCRPDAPYIMVTDFADKFLKARGIIAPL